MEGLFSFVFSRICDFLQCTAQKEDDKVYDVTLSTYVRQLASCRYQRSISIPVGKGWYARAVAGEKEGGMENENF